MDSIGKIYPPSSKRYNFIIVATDYFTKWVEPLPMVNVNQEAVIRFIENQIIQGFGIPEIITADQGTMFSVERVVAFSREYVIKLRHSTPYYAQANGQAEATRLLSSSLKRT